MAAFTIDVFFETALNIIRNPRVEGFVVTFQDVYVIHNSSSLRYLLRGLYSVRTSLVQLSDYSRFAVVRSW
jgi:hypothetical protein